MKRLNMSYEASLFWWTPVMHPDTQDSLNQDLTDHEREGWSLSGIEVHPLGDGSALMVVMYEREKSDGSS